MEPAPEERDLASNLEFWSGRDRPRGGARRGRFRRRLGALSLRLPRPRVPAGGFRPVAAGALVAVLAAAWLVAGHRGQNEGSASAAADPLGSFSAAGEPGATTPPRRAPSPPRSVPSSSDCLGLSAALPEVRCTVGGVDVDARLVEPGAVSQAYLRAVGTVDAARSGSPACARGVPDERAWSSAATPKTAAGRYRCRFEHGRAAMWWTRTDRLVHAVAPDGDLAALFAWWRAHPSE